MEPVEKRAKLEDVVDNNGSDSNPEIEDENEAQDFTELLPEEILMKIFRYTKNQQRVVSWITRAKIDNLQLTCRRWNRIIECHHIFDHCKFFQEPRTEYEIKIFQTSPKRFRSFTFIVHREVDDCYDNFVKKCEKTLTKAKFFFGAKQFPEHYLHSLFSKITVVKELKLEFYGLEISLEDFDRKIMKFPNLKEFELEVHSLDFHIITKFLKFLEMPVLESFECASHERLFPVCENVFHLVNQNLSNLKSFKFHFGRGSDFKWKKNSVDVSHCEEIKLELMNFLRPLAADVTKVDVTNGEGLLHEFLLKEFPEMEEYRSDVDFSYLTTNFYLPKVIIVEIWFFEATQSNIYKLHQTFPNAIMLRLHHPKNLKMSERKLIKMMFKRLQKADWYCFEKGWTKI